jgi:hypothetical protein
MLTPFQWVVLTVEEARKLQDYIERSTATKGLAVNYEILKVGMLEIYSKLAEFVEMSDHYGANLRDFNPDDFAREDYEH